MVDKKMIGEEREKIQEEGEMFQETVLNSIIKEASIEEDKIDIEIKQIMF